MGNLTDHRNNAAWRLDCRLHALVTGETELTDFFQISTSPKDSW